MIEKDGINKILCHHITKDICEQVDTSLCAKITGLPRIGIALNASCSGEGYPTVPRNRLRR